MIPYRLPVIIVIVTIFLTIVFGGIYTFVKRSEAYETAIVFIRENEIFKRHLGDLESERLAFLGYSIRYSGSSGHADFKIYVTAKNGDAIVNLHLKKDLGLWTVIKGNFIFENGKIIMLKD